MNVTISPALKFYNKPLNSLCKSLHQYLPLIILKRLTSEYSRAKMSKNWDTEKNKILKLPIEEKRQYYKSKTYFTLNDIDTWKAYVNQNRDNVRTKTPNEDDFNEFAKIKIDPSRNADLCEKVSIFKGDITQIECDAIVNAANAALKAGGGVDGAIHRAAGPYLQAECYSLGGCPTGEARITGGYNLPAKYVIHTVGPQNGSAPMLESCYKNCLAYQQEYTLGSIAFPCISTGIYGFPNRLAAHIALRAARKHLEEHNMNRIIFCTFMPIDVDIYETLMQIYFPIPD